MIVICLSWVRDLYGTLAGIRDEYNIIIPGGFYVWRTGYVYHLGWFFFIKFYFNFLIDLAIKIYLFVNLLKF